MELRRLLRLVVACAAIVALALPAVAGGAKRPRPDDGTLSVQDGKGLVIVAARGTIIGRLDQGQVRVVDRNPFDSADPIVRGGRLKQRTGTTVVKQGRNIRFRLVGGLFRLRVSGVGIKLAAVGHGTVTLDGDERFADTGVYSLNDEDFAPVPYERQNMQLAAPPPPPPGG